MSCSPFDLRDSFLKELSTPQQLQVEAHVKTCVVCHEEMERLQVTGAALFSLRDEEIPQRMDYQGEVLEPLDAANAVGSRTLGSALCSAKR